MQKNYHHNPITQQRCHDLLANAIPDITLRMVISHMQTIYDTYTLIDMLLNRGFKADELIHDFHFSESYVTIVQHRNPTFGYTAYTPLGTVAAQIPWCDYMLHDDDNIMFMHGLTAKQFATLPVRPERKLNNVLYKHFVTIGKNVKDLVTLLQSTPIAKLWLENIDIDVIDPHAIDMLSDYGIQSAYDMLMLEDDEINAIFRTDNHLAEHFRKQTISSIIMLGTNINHIGTWSDDTLTQLKARNTRHAHELYHQNRRGWLKHMPDTVQVEIQKNLDTFIHEIDNMLASVDSERTDPNA